jgi:alkylation response protein AidB-like acyl-CoA dehydrogenase
MFSAVSSARSFHYRLHRWIAFAALSYLSSRLSCTPVLVLTFLTPLLTPSPPSPQTYGNGLDADGVKLYCAPMAKRVADRAIQTLGGYGYVGEYQVERLWRDAKLLEIGGGTNEAHHKNMARDIKKNHTKIL